MLGHVYRPYVQDNVPIVVVVVERYEHASRGRAVASLGDWLAVGKRQPERFDEPPVSGVIGCLRQWLTALRED